MERLDAKYRESIEDHKVAIWFKTKRRTATQEEARAREMERRRADMERLEISEAARIKAERRYKAE